MSARRSTTAWLLVAVLLTVLWCRPPAGAADVENCLMCHKHRFIGKIDESGKRWNFHVDEILYNKSVHRLVACRDCHTSIKTIPHDPVDQNVDCANRCHIEPPFAQQEFSHQKIVSLYRQSAHQLPPQASKDAKKSHPDCKFCHLNPLYDPVISDRHVPFEKAVRRCYNCHPQAEVTQAYRHMAHRLRKRTTRSPQQIVQLCAKCHRNDSVLKERSGAQPALQVVKSYNRSIHGKLVQLGSSEAADCLSCHASSALHDIYAEDNPRATISAANIADTCQRCHQSTNRWFIQIAVHPGIQPEENRIVAAVSLFFRVALYGTVFGLLGLMLCETFGRRKEGVRLLLNNGTSWRRKSRSRPAKRPGRSDHPLTSYAVGSVFILLSLIVAAGIVHHLTVSTHGPGLLRPLWRKYVEPPKSEIIAEAKRQEEMEVHRRFHKDAPEYPRWPESARPVCFICHSDFPHTKSKKTRGLMNIHTQFFVCETCHIDVKPGTVVDYRWYSPLDRSPEGPFYGTSYDPETGSLSEGKNLIARIAPFVSPAGEEGFRPAILPQDAPMARDYMQVRDQLSPEQREAVKNEFHKKIKPQGHDCKACHSENSILEFQQLGFSENRALILKNLTIVDMLSKYEEFHIPEFFDESMTGR